MTGAEYAAVADAFLNPPENTEPSFRSVARLTGHSQRTIRQVFHNGAAGMAPIVELLEQRARREKLKRLREAEKVEQYLKGLHARLLGGLGRALAEAPVALDPITDTKSARQAVLAVRELAALGRELHGDPDERENGPSVTINIGAGAETDERYQSMNDRQRATARAAESVMLKHAALFAPEHEAVTCELIARRWLMTHPERENEDERDTEQRRILHELYPGEPSNPAIRAALQSVVSIEDEDDD